MLQSILDIFIKKIRLSLNLENCLHIRMEK